MIEFSLKREGKILNVFFQEKRDNYCKNPIIRFEVITMFIGPLIRYVNISILNSPPLTPIITPMMKLTIILIFTTTWSQLSV